MFTKRIIRKKDKKGPINRIHKNKVYLAGFFTRVVSLKNSKKAANPALNLQKLLIKKP